MIKFIYARGIVHYPELMEYLNLSRKSISKYLDLLEETVKQNDVILNRKQRTGIYFTGDLNNLLMGTVDIHQYAEISKDERCNLILLNLAMVDKPLTLDELSEKFYTSKTNISLDVKILKEKLKEEHVEFLSTSKGIQLQSSERIKRRIISKIMFEYWQQTNELTKGSDLPSYVSKFINTNDILDTQEVIESFTKITGISMTDYQYQSLLIHIVIAMTRIRYEKTLPQRLNQNIQYNTKILVRLLEQSAKIKIPDEEISYLNIHILAILHETISPNDVELDKSEMDPLIDFIRQNIGMYDSILVNDLYLHLKPAINRFQLGLQIFNPYTKEIEFNYPKAFDAAFEFSKKLSCERSVNIKADEVAYIALHLQSYFERQNQRNKMQAVIVCSTGMGTAQLMKQRLLQSLGDTLEITRVLSVREVFQTSIHEDLIISTVPIEMTNKPVITLSPFFSSEEVLSVTRRIHEMKMASRESFVTLLHKDLIFPTGTLSTREEVISFVCQKLLNYGYTQEKLEKTVIERENVISTATSEPPIAFPHGDPNYIKKQIIVIYINPKGIKWGENNVKIVFFLGLNKQVQNNLDNIYKFFLKILDNHRKLSRIINLNNSADILKELNDTSIE